VTPVRVWEFLWKLSRQWDSEKRSRVPGRPAPGGLKPALVSSFDALCQAAEYLPVHKLFGWPGFGFNLHNLSDMVILKGRSALKYRLCTKENGFEVLPSFGPEKIS